MRFLVEECSGPGVARWLADQEHDVSSVYDERPGIDDAAVIGWAHDEDRILVTNDKDFGERVYREGRDHCGVILLRLDDERTPNKIAALRDLLCHHGDRLEGRFVVVTEEQIRFAQP